MKQLDEPTLPTIRVIKKITAGEKTVLVIDYSGLKEAEMIALVDELKSIVISENKPQRILSVYNSKNFATPKFMRHVETVTQEVIHLIDKMAITGLSDIQRFILKGYNLLFKRDFPCFQTEQEAIAYLFDDSEKEN